MQKGKMLKLGDAIGVISPASPSEHQSELIRATEYCQAEEDENGSSN